MFVTVNGKILPCERIGQQFALGKVTEDGSLILSVTGDVSTNLHNTVLGNVRKDALVDIVHKEMIVNTAWRKIRDNQPCSDCLFQYLCPSPSEYEQVIGKCNLCHIATSFTGDYQCGNPSPH